MDLDSDSPNRDSSPAGLVCPAVAYKHSTVRVSELKGQ